MATLQIHKEEVFNPISLYNNVGRELESIIEARAKDKDLILRKLGKNNFEEISRLSRADAHLLTAELAIEMNIYEYFKRFREDYLRLKETINLQHKKSTRKYRELHDVTSLLNPEYTDGMDILEDITNFFGVETEDDIPNDRLICDARFKLNPKMDINVINLNAWIRRGEIDFQELELEAYNEAALMEWIESRQWLSNVDDSKYFKELQNTFSKFGVALICIKYLPKTVYGAVTWKKNNPIVMVSDRNHDLAGCWFTLFHELGHVVKHKDQCFCDLEINSATTKIEKEANQFASDYLFGGDGLRKEAFVNDKRITATYLSQKYHVPMIFASYWLRKAQHDVQSYPQKYIYF